MIEIGKYNTLRVVRKVDFGYYLDGEEWGDILFPIRYAPADLALDSYIDVIVYLDGEERLVATTEKPFGHVGEVAYLKVSEVNEFGAFLDWGLMKELFAPFALQKDKMEKGKSYLVYIYLDEITERIVASSKISRFVDLAPPLFKEKQKLEGIVWSKTDFAYKVIINHSNTGILYTNEVFRPLHTGDKIWVYIKKIRDDLKIDLSLYNPEIVRFDEFSELILEKLRANNGFLKVSDASSADIIYQTFGMSKKNFKKSIGMLYKAHKIIIHNDGIQLV
ncbi:MAG: GntR family transcriptional regulator [Saprospiraceae bacterium]|nr:GntR family transcriptional regulator [Saprospiraceae bacterium]